MGHIIGDAERCILCEAGATSAGVKDIILPFDIDCDVGDAAWECVLIIGEAQIKSGAARKAMCAGPKFWGSSDQIGEGRLIGPP